MANVNKIDIEGEQWDIEDTQARSLAEAAQETADEANTLASETAQGLTTLENKAVTHTPGTPLGSTITPVYIKDNGVPDTIAKATYPASGSQYLITSGGVYSFMNAIQSVHTDNTNGRINNLPLGTLWLIYIWDSTDESKHLLGTVKNVYGTTPSLKPLVSDGLYPSGPNTQNSLAISGASGTLYWVRLFGM